MRSRSEQEMYSLILDFAGGDERIRAVGLNGSRANKNVPKDPFQDFDAALLVTDVASFVEDDSWLASFGPILILQKPEASTLLPPAGEGWFTFLAQFADGNRIDFCFWPVSNAQGYIQNDPLTKILLDKDGLFPNLPEPSDGIYHVQRPTAQNFADCCNEFWWVSLYVAKGLWRGEFLYGAEHLDNYVRPMLLQMLSWQVGFDTGFSLSVGKCCKYLHRYLRPGQWKKLLSTYCMDGEEACWQALFATAELFREVALVVAGLAGCAYNQREGTETFAFMKHIRQLPRNAERIFE